MLVDVPVDGDEGRSGTSCGVATFHWARRWRVLLRDIFRLGTAMGAPGKGEPVEQMGELVERAR